MVSNGRSTPDRLSITPAPDPNRLPGYRRDQWRLEPLPPGILYSLKIPTNLLMKYKHRQWRRRRHHSALHVVIIIVVVVVVRLIKNSTVPNVDELTASSNTRRRLLMIIIIIKTQLLGRRCSLPPRHLLHPSVHPPHRRQRLQLLLRLPWRRRQRLRWVANAVRAQWPRNRRSAQSVSDGRGDDSRQ